MRANFNKNNSFLLYFMLAFSFIVSIYNANASGNEDQKFVDWTMSCKQKSGDSSSTCFISQTLESKDEAKNKIANLKLRYSKEGVLKLIETLPFGIKIQLGSHIISEGKVDNPIAEGEFITCHDYGCIAHAILYEEEVRDIIESKKNVLRVTSMEGKLVDIPFSNNGLKEALDALQKRQK